MTTTYRNCPRDDNSSGTIRSLRDELELTNKGIVALNLELDKNIRELERLNGELESFAYSVSHDLRQPLRSIDVFIRKFVQEYGEKVDARGMDYLTHIQLGASRMGDMIDGLLNLSRVSRTPLELRPVALDAIARTILSELQEQNPECAVKVMIDRDMLVCADPKLMASALQNLLSNAWKYSAHQSESVISFRQRYENSQRVFEIQDNGVGFDMSYADKLFSVFQRLHSSKEFEGLGIGLATTARIIERHGGQIWARSAPGQGAAFTFTLP